jgi:hypothetical protein
MPSSVIARMSYDADNSVLKIIFVSGKVYNYKEVPKQIYEDMKSSGSKGIYFNKYIKDHYPFEEITN